MKIVNSENSMCETNVDIDGKISLRINDEIDAHGKVSLRDNLINNCKIYCEHAIITVPDPWLPQKKTFIEVETKSRYYKKIILSEKSVYEHQIDASTDFFSEKNPNLDLLIGIEQSLKISKIIDFWKKNNN